MVKMTIILAGNWFWACEYLKFGIHIFTMVKQQIVFK